MLDIRISFYISSICHSVIYLILLDSKSPFSNYKHFSSIMEPNLLTITRGYHSIHASIMIKRLVPRVYLSAHQAPSQAPTGLLLIAYFPLLLKIHSKYGPVCKIAHCTIWTVTKGVTNLQTEYEATEALAEVASLSLNSIAKTRIQCSSLLGSSRPDSVDLPKLSLALGNLPRGSFGYWEFPRSRWSHPRGRLGVLSVSFTVSRFPLRSPSICLSLYKYEALPLLNIITFTTHTLLIRDESKT